MKPNDGFEIIMDLEMAALPEHNIGKYVYNDRYQSEQDAD